MATKKEYYSYALDENSHLIEINDAAKGFEYRCPNCDAIMIPRQGECGVLKNIDGSEGLRL